MLKQIRIRIILTNMILVFLILISSGAYMLVKAYFDFQNSAENNLRMSVDMNYDSEHLPSIGKKPHTDKTNSTNEYDDDDIFDDDDVIYSSNDARIRYVTRAVLCVSYKKSDKSITKVIETASMDKKTLSEAVRLTLGQKKEFGVLFGQGLYYYKSESPEYITIAFADFASAQSYVLKSSIRYFFIGILVLIILSFVSLLISRIAIRPIKKTWEQEQRFVADVSHELKTPITVILANNSIIKSHINTTVSEQLKWIESTDVEAKHMKKLVSNMLDLSFLESGKGKPEFKDINFGTIIERIMLQFEVAAFEKNINFVSHIDLDIIVHGDETNLQQLAFILIDNAIKYSPNGETITITLIHNGKFAVFAVNTFSFIDEDDVPHLFERFFRADVSRNIDSDNSYGLGLSIAKTIVNEHKGKIKVESNKDIGTTFSVALKCSQHKQSKPTT